MNLTSTLSHATGTEARIGRRALLLAGAGALGTLPAFGQAAYPNKPVRVVVTFPPGGSTDAAMRIVAPKLSERLGQPVVIDNRPGAGGGIGLALVAQAAPDGYTLVLASAGGLTANSSLYAKPGYDAMKDLAPVTMFGTSPFVLVAKSSLPARNVQEAIAAARAKPGALSYASGGNGTAMHLAGELFKSMTRTYIVHVPYRGSGPALMAAAGGEADLAVVDIATLRPLLATGRVKPLGVMDPQRSPLAPNIPTLAESGVPGYDAAGWFAVLAPAGTPVPILDRLNTEINAVLKAQDVRERFADAGLEPLPSTREQLAERMRTDTAKWSKVVKTANIRLD